MPERLTAIFTPTRGTQKKGSVDDKVRLGCYLLCSSDSSLSFSFSLSHIILVYHSRVSSFRILDNQKPIRKKKFLPSSLNLLNVEWTAALPKEWEGGENSMH